MNSRFRLGGFFNVKCFKNYEKKNLLWQQRFHNLVVDEALIAIIADYFSGSWYIGLKGSIEAPAAGWTSASIGVDFTELEAYSELTRELWDKGAISTKNPSNSATPAEFNIVAPGGTFYGAFIIDDNTKGGDTGQLWCVSDALASQAVAAGNIIQIVYTLTSQDISE